MKDLPKTPKTQELYRRAKEFIPGGTQLLSKRPEMFAPDIWPGYYSRAKGCRVWDLDGNEYIDVGTFGVGAAIIGYADDEVDDAVVEALRGGVATSLNCPEEVELAELLVSLHPWADMVRYARSGGEALAMAIRIARAATGRDVVMFSGYHGWMDWYLAANLGETDALDGQLMPGLEPKGVPRGLKGTAVPFFFSDIDNLREKIAGREKEIAAVIVEPARGDEAPGEYLTALKETTKDLGAVLIFDEITTAFRMNPGGLHLRYGIDPDMAVFAKSMANGYAMAAVIGSEAVMQSAQMTFMSSTNWTERIGPTAALATIRKYIRERVADHIIRMGRSVLSIWEEAARKHHLQIHLSKFPTLAHFEFEGEKPQERATFYTIEMLKRGFLGYRQFKPSYAHREEEIQLYGRAVDEVFELVAGTPPEELLSTPPAHKGFYRLTRE